MLIINDHLSIDNRFWKIVYIRSGGPGGQNVNKVNTRAQLTFYLDDCDVLPRSARSRLEKLAGRRLTKDQTVILESDRFRSQPQNRREVLNRLAQLIRKALIAPKKRFQTHPTAASRRRDRQDKQHHAKIKSLRKNVPREE